MGRNADTKELLSRPPVALNPRTGAWSRPWYTETTTAGLSATASITALSIQGPGVINALTLQWPQAASSVVQVRVWVDNELAMSASWGAFVGFGALTLDVFGQAGVSGSGAVAVAVPFKQSFLCTYEVPSQSISCSMVVRSAWMLT